MHTATSCPESLRTIDALSRPDALREMLESHVAAARTVETAFDAIDTAAAAVALALGSGGQLVYAAAGSSGLMALADASELRGTFGIPHEQVRIEMAGGVPADGRMPGDTEDETELAIAVARRMRPADVALVVSASGTTPFACAFAETARDAGATVIGIANVAGSKLLELSDVAIALPTAPEVVAGSTRLGAGTSQKIALNMISTQAGILLGHVHDGLMVNLIPDNIKLRKRAASIVQHIAGVPAQAAEAALKNANYNTKQAILLAAGAEFDQALELLTAHGGRLRDCLARIQKSPKPKN